MWEQLYVVHVIDDTVVLITTVIFSPSITIREQHKGAHREVQTPSVPKGKEKQHPDSYQNSGPH